MKIVSQFFLACLMSALISTSWAEPIKSGNSFNPKQRQQIETVIADYIKKNPQLLLESAARYQEQYNPNETSPDAALNTNGNPGIEQFINRYGNTFLNSAMTPTLGNPIGNITVVEFFDYRCAYCKKVDTILFKLIHRRPDVRILMKEWPVFGPISEFASKAALAAKMQDQYSNFHQALMGYKGSINDQEDIITIAQKVGLDVSKLRKDMDNPAIAQELNNNTLLARELGLKGTPAFIIHTIKNNEHKFLLIPSAIDLASLEKAIKDISR